MTDSEALAARLVAALNARAAECDELRGRPENTVDDRLVLTSRAMAFSEAAAIVTREAAAEAS